MLFLNKEKCLQSVAFLDYDQACIDLNNQLNDNITIFGQYEQCHKCNFQNLTTLKPLQNYSLLVNTRSPLTLYWEQNEVDHCRQEIFIKIINICCNNNSFLVSLNCSTSIIAMGGTSPTLALTFTLKNPLMMPIYVSNIIIVLICFKASVQLFSAILMAFVVLFCFGTMWYMVKCIYKNSGRLRQFLAWSTELEEVSRLYIIILLY